MGSINEDYLRRIQIRETIRTHLERERQLFGQKIKVLNLFFIDHVDSYRLYEGDDPKGKFAKIIEIQCSNLTERQKIILDLIKESSAISQEQMSQKIGVAIKTIQRDLKAMNHIVQRIGGDNGGHWEIIK